MATYAKTSSQTLSKTRMSLLSANFQLILQNMKMDEDEILSYVEEFEKKKIEELIVYGFMIVKEENKKMLEMHFKVDWEKHRLYIKDGKEYVEYTEIEGICGLLCTEKYVNTFFNIVENRKFLVTYSIVYCNIVPGEREKLNNKLGLVTSEGDSWRNEPLEKLTDYTSAKLEEQTISIYARKSFKN